MIAARALPMGEEAVLIELDDLASVVSLAARIETCIADSQAPWQHVEDIVPAARTIAVRTHTPQEVGQAAVALAAELPTPRPPTGAHTSAAPVDDVHGEAVVTIEVTYDGQDLSEVAELTQMSQHEVIAAHTGAVWSVAFFGFAPGFAYLVGSDDRLQVPRRAQPRTAVPPGAVALAGEFSAVYPRESPGGWQLLGHTTELMWDSRLKQPSRLRPGDRVRFTQAAR